jgi:multiple sugar transport system substrate-binding protein
VRLRQEAAIAFAIVITVGGCSSSSTTPFATPSATAPPEAASATPSQGAPSSPITGQTITVITSQAPWNPAYGAAIEAYEKATGNTVDLRPFPNPEVKTQMLNDAQAGTHAFDVYQINEVDLAFFNDGGLLLPLTDVDPNFKLDPEIYTYDNEPYWDATARNFAESGTLTNVPLLGNLQILVYKCDSYRQAGLQVPTTWEDTVANGQAIQKAGIDKYGFVTRFQGVPGSPSVTYDFMGILYGEGGQVFRDPGVDWRPALDTPQAIQAARVFRELAKLGPNDPKALGQAEAIAVMQSGDSAQLSVVAAAANSMNDPDKSNIAGNACFAKLPGGKSASGTWNLGIPADLPQGRRAAALDFIKWITSKEGQEAFVVAGGIPVRSDVYDAPGIPDASKAYLSAASEGAKTAVGPLRLVFIGDFLTATEPIIGSIAAGDVSPEDGMAQLQEAVSGVVQKAGFPMK